MLEVDIILKYKGATYIRLSKADNYTKFNGINDQKVIIKEKKENKLYYLMQIYFK